MTETRLSSFSLRGGDPLIVLMSAFGRGEEHDGVFQFHESNFMTTAQKRASLTNRQLEIYDFLRDQILNRGYGPTVREIGDHFGIKSPNGVMCHLKALEKKGLISRESNMSRAICLSETVHNRLSIPFVGTAISGGPIQSAVSSEETVDFAALFNGDDRACIRVKGGAFRSLGICDGDFIIVNRGGTAPVGGLIAALDDRHSVTVHRVECEGQPSVPAIPGAYPAPTHKVLGTVVGIVRSLGTTAGETASRSSGVQAEVVMA